MEGWAVNYGFRSDKKESIKNIHNVSPRNNSTMGERNQRGRCQE
jgi:hypothetical protein